VNLARGKMNKKPALPVTQPSLPPFEEFIPYLQKIWESRVLTNCGPFHKLLEDALCEYLQVPHISLFTNGTIALITALQALRITGEVITTPYSFVATSHSLVWNSIKPVFVDIDETTLNIDPQKIEAAITPQTTAILAVHCYGRPCNVDEIQRIASTYNLKVIYDAAHAFGVACHCGSVLNHGELSVLSFHATKVFNTFEGGAVVCQDAEAKQRIDFLKNFGIVDETTIVAPGINGKLSEFNAALGLLQLKYIDQSIQKRQSVYIDYRTLLADVAGVQCVGEKWLDGNNFGYFPVLITEDYPLSRDDLYYYMRQRGVMVRRYFYPLISDLPMYRGLASAQDGNLKVARRVADQVLCLPIYEDLRAEDQLRVCRLIAEAGRA
jgi:dTDP-4-amino-4,6-dideoxygalactose transaminase